MPAVPGHTGIVILGPQLHGRDILQAHHRIVLLTHDELPEAIQRVQIGIGGQIHGHHLALGTAHRGQIIVGGERVVHITRRDVAGRHALRIKPGTQRVDTRALHVR